MLTTYPRTERELSAADTWTDALLVGMGDVLILVAWQQPEPPEPPEGEEEPGLLSLQSREVGSTDWDYMAKFSAIDSQKVLEMPVSGREIRVGFMPGDYTSGIVTVKVAQG